MVDAEEAATVAEMTPSKTALPSVLKRARESLVIGADRVAAMVEVGLGTDFGRFEKEFGRDR